MRRLLFFFVKEKDVSSCTDETLGTVKLLLKEVVPHLLAKNGSKQLILSANTYLMQQESSLGLTWKILNRDQLPHNLGWPKAALIESLGTDVFAKVNMSCKCYLSMQKFYFASLSLVFKHVDKQLRLQ